MMASGSPDMTGGNGWDMDAESEFDYVIVGAGAAGCVLANRLSADPDVSVCLIEAGGSDRKFPVSAQVRIPAAVVTLIANPRHNWMHAFSGGGRIGERTVPCPRGRILGGSSSINGMIYTRGHRGDFDHWAALGNEGWSYDDVLPAFRRCEDFAGGESRFHGVGGGLSVAAQRSLNPLSHAFMHAVRECGLPLNDDFNGAQQEGFGLFHVTQRNGERCSSARGFLHPVAGRQNLEIMTDALVARVNFDGRRATGVSVTRHRREQTIRARREVVLAAGAVGSPQLLMLSGVGEARELARHGIPLVHDLPGVGRNLQDHQDVTVIASGTTADSIGLSWSALPGMAAAPFQYLFGRRGVLSGTTIEAGGFVRSGRDVDRPDVELIFAPLLKNQFGRLLPRGHGFTIHVSLLRPESRGRITLKSADPNAKPEMRMNFLESEWDVKAMVEGVRLSRRLLAARAFDGFREEELAPGPDVQTDEEIVAFLERNVATTYHAAGSCKMGHDPMAVVDNRLRVRGIEGLRVIDASIMPTIVAAPTYAASVMIGEMGAGFITSGAG